MRSDISEARERILSAIAAMPVGNVKLMEVCGTHTMAIAKSGLRAVLPENVQLLSGPGCPVCVTPPEVIDAVLTLAMRPEVIIASYGDMLRVPGSKRGDSLARRRALHAHARRTPRGVPGGVCGQLPQLLRHDPRPCGATKAVRPGA